MKNFLCYERNFQHADEARLVRAYSARDAAARFVEDYVTNNAGTYDVRVKATGSRAGKSFQAYSVECLVTVTYQAYKSPPFLCTSKMFEQAAIYCSAMASWWMDPRLEVPEPLTNAPPGVGALANSARYATGDWPSARMPEDLYRQCHAEAWAEAEALLRTGWTP